MSIESLLSEEKPSIDLRAPAEFLVGAIPGAINLPILNDDERARIGTTYKHAGPDAARALGYKLVSGGVRSERIKAWSAVLEKDSSTPIYCWRGGERSKIACQWLTEAGFTPHRIEGGYKAIRHACLSALDRLANNAENWWVLAGRTGSGKTEVLHKVHSAVDLEGLAAHRGSAFGSFDHPQPTPASFENALACKLLHRQNPTVPLEDESRTIGRLAIPEAVHQRMQRSPLVLLEQSFDVRVANIRREYVDERVTADNADAVYATYADALKRIRKRLGGERQSEVLASLEHGFANGDHDRWIAQLLEWYYDPMYDYQLSKKMVRVRFKGGADDVTEYLNAL